MKDVKKRIAKVLSFLLVVSMVFIMVQSHFPMQISEEATQSLENKQAMAAVQTGSIDNWLYRVDSYAARIGRKLPSGKEEQKWLFYDTNNVYKNLYCIQSGDSQAMVYNIYDLYSLSDDDAMIKKYFGGRETYEHFMWILENMYLVGQTGSSKTYMESQLFKNMGDTSGNIKSLYEKMQSELQGLYKNAGVKQDGNTEYLTSYHYNGKKRVASDYTYATDGRDNFIKTIQNYLLLSYSLQRSNSYGLNPIDANGNITLNLRTYSNDGSAVKEEIGNDKVSKQFVHQLLLYLVRGYNKNSYNINRYKNFENDAYVNTTINSTKAKYNNDTKRVGPFYVNNKYGFNISFTNVVYGPKTFASNEYKIVDANGNNFNVSQAGEGREFYVEITTDFEKNSNYSMNIGWNVDFGEVPEAKIFVPTSGTNNQVLIDIERTHRTKHESWQDSIPVLKADIALKKYIVSVNGNQVADRLTSIDLTNLKENKTPHNATYNMNKTPVDVNVGDTVTYAIRIFNEGEADGTASKITDHLPSYLTFEKAYSSDGTELEAEKTNYGRDVTITTKLAKIGAFSNNDTEESFKAKSQVIYVDCKVCIDIGQQKIYTNIAEISEYEFSEGADIDSKSDNWSIGTSDRTKHDWIDYTNNQNEWLDNEMHPFVGQEDDDDFDKVKVRFIDLALTKRIEGKIKEDGTEEYLVPEGTSINKSRIEISGYEDVKAGKARDLTYNMNKKPAIVSRGDKLITVLTVYNEGELDGVVKQITDYLPVGLNYNEEETKKLNGSNISYTYNKYSRYLTIKINGEEGVTLKNLNSFDKDVDKFEIRIVTDVDENANGRLYNSAQIIDYGYVDINGTYNRAYGPGVDIDSMGATSGDVVVNKHRASYMSAEAAEFDLTQYNKNNLQNEDDDDVDSVEVVYKRDFDLALRKYIYKVEKDFKWSDGKNYTITYPERVPTLNARSLTALNNEGTAEYYHDKLKVNVEKGDLVTYRIRVYNEGVGEAYDGRATQVTDYLPAGVEFVGLEEGYNKEWKVTAYGQVITFDYVGDTIIEANSIEKMATPTRGKNDYYQEIGIVCKVTADATTSDFNGKALTNRAAITGDEAFDNGKPVEGVTDKDSHPEDLTDPKLDTWYDDTIDYEGNPEWYYPGEEDDDDFDTIYVNNYTINLEKTDGTNTLSGVDFKVYKYRYVAYPEQKFEAVELTDVENSLKANGTATYTTNAPSTGLERDYYVIKEIKTNSDYINPFEGKYVEFYMYNNDGEMVTGTWSGSQAAKGYAVYEDNGDEDYFNDKIVDYNSKDENSVYKFATLDAATGAIKLTMINTKIIPEGYYKVNLKKLGTDGKQLGGVQFEAQGKFNGAENASNLRAEGEYIVTDAKTTVDVMPKDIPSGVIDIDPAKVNIPDEIVLKETGIAEGAVNSDGEPVNTKYYLGLEGKEIKVTINKNQKTEGNKLVSYVESIKMSVGGEETKKVSDTEYEYSLEDGSKVTVKYVEDSKTIEITVVNPEKPLPEGYYKVNLKKLGTDGKQLGGVQFDAQAKFNGAENYSSLRAEGEYIVTDAKTTVDVMPKDIPSGVIDIDPAKVNIPDEIVLKETGIAEGAVNSDGEPVNTKYYLGLEGKEIKVTINKNQKTEGNKIISYVESIKLNVGDKEVSKVSDTEYEYSLEDGSKVNVKYVEDTKTIEVTVVNPEIIIKEGSFDINLIKTKTVDEDGDGKNDPLAGATFKITIDDSTGNPIVKDGLVTDGKGNISKINVPIKGEGITYTITVEETDAPEGYIGLAKAVSFTAESALEGNTYILKAAEKTQIENDSMISRTVKPGEILIEAENRVEPEIHKGVKTVENQDSGYDKNEIQTWVINTTVPTGIKDYAKYIVTDTIDYEKSNVAEKRIEFINEAKPEENVVVKYKGTDTTLVNGKDYFVAFNTDSKVLVVTFINDKFNGGKSLEEGSTIEITYNTKFVLDENGNILGINQAIPNTSHLTFNGNGNEEKTKKSETPEVHTGGVGVFKYDTATNKALEGAHFKIARTEADAKAGKFVKVRDENGNETEADYEVVTGADGYAKFEGLEFGEDAKDKSAASKHKETGATVYEYDWSKAATDYYMVETEAPAGYVLVKDPIKVTVKAANYEKADLTEFHKVGNTPVTSEGGYDVKLIKYGKFNGNKEPLSGVKFVATRTVNNKEKEELGTITTDDAGSVQVGDAVTIDKDALEVVDEYTIKEDSVSESSEYYIGFDKEIKLQISKQALLSEDGSKYINSVKSIKMVIEGEEVTEIQAGTKYLAKVVKDGQELEIIAELNGSTITLTIENPHKVGEFNLNLVKYIKGTDKKKTLSGAGFKVSIKANGEAVVDGKGNKVDGTQEYFVNEKGNLTISGLNISKAGVNYAVEIEESTVPDGYIGLDEKVGFTTKSVVNGNKLSLEKSTETISNDVKVSVGENEIWVDVENSPEPVIHKGVDYVENQDAGYDKNETQTWVINSTVPAGISKYTKYVITDTIDPEKTVVSEKRIYFVNEESPKDNVVVKIKETGETVNKDDYNVTFDKDNKVLTITFIDGDFKKGQSLPESTTLEITFNTRFTLDADGNILGLNQAVPNTSELTYGTESGEEKTKKSETPEVHTGGVGVFKFDEKTGKALEGAHFKIARSEENAKNGIFVKVRNEDGKETDTDYEVVTGKDGKASFVGLEFGEAAKGKVKLTKHSETGAPVYTYDWTKVETTYYIVETEAPEDFQKLDSVIPVTVKYGNYDNVNLTKYFEVGNKPKEYDLSLRKFIVQVENRAITDREPRVTLTDDFKSGKTTTAIYEHTKEPVITQQGNIVTYTIRVYNEGPEDAYAAVVKDDIPDGTEFITYTEGDGSINDKYGWKLLDANGNEVTDSSKAKYIVTNYLAKENGEDKLIKAYDNGDTLDYKDVKVQFRVTEPNTSERILTNYAQISKMTNSNGKVVTDRDSTPDEWIEGEDDQDIENIKLLYFDLALRKWVTKAIVYENGQEVVYETGHHAEDDPEDVVKVDLKRSKLDKVVVKFEYQIRVTNEGKIGGSATEVTDHIPDGLVFDEADNAIWTKVDDNTIVTNALEDVYLDPGESAEVTVTLRWANSASNLGIKNNIAEISKDQNEYGVADIDSLPGNYKWGEDDIDDAPVMLAIKTGSIATQCVALGIGVLFILVFGIKSIKKSFKDF